MKPTQNMIENGKMLTATAANDTMRILSICIDALTEARDYLHEIECKEPVRQRDDMESPKNIA